MDRLYDMITAYTSSIAQEVAYPCSNLYGLSSNLSNPRVDAAQNIPALCGTETYDVERRNVRKFRGSE